MTSTAHNSGTRSNAYSESKFTNWTSFQPFHSEAVSALKKFARKLSKNPERPSIFILKPHPEFIHPCNRSEIQTIIARVPQNYVHGLKGIFMLSGTTKQLRCWNGRLCCYGTYWRDCIFLYAHPFALGHFNLDSIKDFYLKDVLLHEIGHHVDRFRDANNKTSEGFASWFALHYSKAQQDAAANP